MSRGLHYSPLDKPERGLACSFEVPPSALQDAPARLTIRSGVALFNRTIYDALNF